MAAIFMAYAGIAQTAQQRRQITKDYDHQKLKAFSEKMRELNRREMDRSFNYALDNSIPFVRDLEGGGRAFLHRVGKNGSLFYRKLFDSRAARTTNTDALYSDGDLGLDIEGRDMTIGIWDGGAVRKTHELLKGKVSQIDDPDKASGRKKDSLQDGQNHATHIAGNLVGRDLGGRKSVARGMAFKADLKAWDYNNDLAEMAEAADEGLLVSNHSYGNDLEFLSHRYLGGYGSESSQLDYLTYQAPYLTVVSAAGNDGSDSDTGFPKDDQDRYGILASAMTTAKNNIVVGAVDKVLQYDGPSSVKMSSFSSWGPTNDNRVKPDITADGINIFSSWGDADDSYALGSGTSMATPNVAGSLILLQELSSELNAGYFIKTATIKAIIIQTALQADSDPGPDPRYGWGLLDMKGAAQLMLDEENNGNAGYDERTLIDGNTYTEKLRVQKDGELGVTMAWADPSGDTQKLENSRSNPITSEVKPVLINDLDLRITDKDGKTYYPWRLAKNYEDPAENDGDNAVDNIEQIVIPHAEKDQVYTLEVSHKKELKNGEQDFSLAYSGAKTDNEEDAKRNELKIYPNPAVDQVHLNLKEAGNDVEVVILDLSGRQVLTHSFRGNHATLNISKLASGLYLVHIVDGAKKTTKKLLVK